MSHALQHNEHAQNSPPADRRCPFCLEKIHPEAQRCPHCRTWLTGNPLQNEWFRGGPELRIAGVCSGLAMQFSISVTIIRLLFVLSTIFGGGIGLVLYILLWFIMPKLPEPGARQGLPPQELH